MIWRKFFIINIFYNKIILIKIPFNELINNNKDTFMFLLINNSINSKRADFLKVNNNTKINIISRFPI